MIPPVDAGPLRRLIYPLLITVAAAAIGGRILAVTRVYEPGLSRTPGAVDDPRGEWPSVRPKPMPTMGANDRSRWATIRALVDRGTYVIGRRDPSRATSTNRYGDEGIVTEEGWQTIDKVLNPNTNEFYSSKPPFLPTILAGEYWLLKQAFGWSITDPDGKVVVIILFTINWLPMVISLVLLARLVDRLGASDWGRLYVVAAGCFATFLTPFAITLNNHLVAAWSGLFALYFALPLLTRPDPLTPPPLPSGERGWGEGGRLNCPLAGFFAGFTACNELPAASFALLLLAILLFRRPMTFVCFVPAMLVPVALFFLANYLALGQLRPAYSELGGPWYEYEGSYWKTQQGMAEHRGIDWAGYKETPATYAFHLLAGHHGLFSLSPVFILAFVGIAGVLFRRGAGDDSPDDSRVAPRAVAGLTLVLTLIVVGFYIFAVPVKAHNYGGWTSGPRWLMWLTPFFLLSMIPAADWLSSRRWGRCLAYVLLGISVISVSYPAWNPWRHPWLYDFMQTHGWIQY